MIAAGVRPSVQEWEALPHPLREALALVSSWERELRDERDVRLYGAMFGGK